MNLEELEQELDVIIQEASLKPHFRTWLNQAVEEVAADFHLPGLKLLEPHPLPVSTDKWLYDLPENFHKEVFRVRRGNMEPVALLRTMADLDRLDPDHDELGPQVTRAAAEAGRIGVFPKADDTLWLWYWRKPTPMERPQDEPDGIPPAFHYRVLIPKVVIKNFKLLQDLMVQPPHPSLAWWQEEYRSGLFGSPRGDIGMINFFARAKGPRRHGGRDPLP
ncbi:MAG: hypothetical protein QME75_12420 [Deltaproteobacteria bacterium]|nr:hypothetical protein [Deltaproteobacteria bacterium]